MQILGRPVNNIGVLVVKDCPPGSFSDNKKRVPGLIGSNVLKYIFESLYEVANQAFQNVIESDSSWNSAYNAYSAVHATCNNIESSSDDGHIGFVKLAGKSPVKIPANTSIAVKGTTKQLSEPYEALIETEVGGSLPNGLHIAPTFCTVVHGSVEVQVSNITNRDIWISKNQRIAEAFSASEVLPEVTVQYDSSGSPEIVFSSQCSAEEFDINSLDTGDIFDEMNSAQKSRYESLMVILEFVVIGTLLMPKLLRTLIRFLEMKRLLMLLKVQSTSLPLTFPKVTFRWLCILMINTKLHSEP